MSVVLPLQGMVAVVAGGSGGIGRAIVACFLQAGALVAFNGRDAIKCARVLAELDAGDRAICVPGDARNRSDIEALIDAAVHHFGAVDVMVNSVGGPGRVVPLAEMSDREWHEIISLNLDTVLYGTQAALRQMIPNRCGRIINISSLAGKQGRAGTAAYVAAKHAVNGLTKCCAKEVGSLGITVNAICPGLVMTEAVEEGLPAAATARGMSADDLLELYTKQSALGRLNTVEEVAAVALLLASAAGAGITGAMLSVDGGASSY